MTPHGGAEFRDGTHLEDGPDHGAPDTTNESLQETGSAGPYESSGSASKTMPKIPIANTKPVPFDLAPPWPRTSSQSFLLLHPPEHLPKLKISDHQTTCQDLRSAGFVGIETIDCGPGEGPQTFCCLIASSPPSVAKDAHSAIAPPPT
ncbi:hypothetical protein PENNAL_c0009G05088 [Penicillium nalgiovense]|uniref:Uncharacterized protein n=1 Tax=Penicillium nalgiovense TaxID=60175 RepID=A0A1V6YW17_PENNA|nr:hypothetical protein PENNAL_c0009G05088 [Penicillium nalgiovense]